MNQLITLSDPRSAAAEAYQSLRTNLEFFTLEQPLHTLLVTSADDMAEKSVAIANLAIAMAQVGDRVTLVDGDLRRPQQHTIFGLSNSRGLSNWLTEEGPPPLQKTEVDGLQVLTSGPSVPNPVALLSRRQLVQGLEELQEQTDYVLVDAPPILAVTDAALWAGKVNGVVMLINAGGTKRDHAERAKSILETVHAHIVGAVLLNAERDISISGDYR